jgi:hypothetical protein
MQMIERSSGSSLLIDWIGTDARVANADPLVLMIGGLPAGPYAWTSYHHDTQDQTGLFDVTVADADGSETTKGIDISNGPAALEGVTRFETEIVSDGMNPVALSFVNQGYAQVSEAFFVMNALVLEALNPCHNQPPVVEAFQALSVSVGEPTVIHIIVTDDGLPTSGGCPAGQPQGPPYGLEYTWSQQSGPTAVEMDPASVHVEDPTITFPQPGTYELLLQVSDGPVGQGPEDGKTVEVLLVVETLEPIKGDIDRNGIVDYLDLGILADQWLDTPPCPEGPYCADLDDSGRVTARDFALFGPNWRTETASVVINEFVASNRRSLTDGDGNTSDWIELFNGAARSVSLNGWCLTDDEDNLRKWPFPPETVLPAGAYLVVFASGQSAADHIDDEGNLHTNFALDRDGEYLALVHPSGRVVHAFAPSFPPQEIDVSYGMWHGQARYFAKPTPGRANELAFAGFTEQTTHSHWRGFYDQPFALRFFCETPNAFIRYTLDGSEPTEQHGLVYDPQMPVPITTTTHVRSVAFKPGWRTGRLRDGSARGREHPTRILRARGPARHPHRFDLDAPRRLHQ